MGKVAVSSKQSETSVNKSTRVIKQAALSKPTGTQNVRFKRLLMIQRRLNAVMNEKNSWEEQNKDLSDALKAEKLLSASLKKESFHWQRLYHESAIAVNSYKVKQFEMAEALSLCLREIDSIYPHMVAFSESVTSNKIRLSNLLNNLPSSEHNSLLKKFQDGRGISEEYKQNGNPTKHRVGPMVKGHQIVTKPKIMIERLALPQVQNQDQVNDDMSHFEVDNRLTPIPEENEREEVPCYRHISIRPRRSKLGSSWRMKRQDKMKTDQDRERVREPYSGTSSESDDVPPSMNRFDHVSHLIKSSSLRKVDTGGRIGEGEGVGRQPLGLHFSARPDDPLEGSSWMYTNSYRPPHNERRSSIYKSDSTDDEDDVVVQKKSPNLLSMNTLLVENQTFNDCTSNNRTKKSGSYNHNTSTDCPIEEPDSTNNDSQIQNKNSLSFKDSPESLFKPSSSSSTVSSSRNSPELSTDYGTANNTMEQLLSNQTQMPSVRLSKVPYDESTSRENSLHSNRNSIVCDSPRSAVDRGSGKRVRKPANHRYPSEEYIVPNVKVKSSKIARLSNGHKSPAVNGKTKIKGAKAFKRRISSETNTNTNVSTNADGFDVEPTKPDAVNTSNKRNSKSKTSSSKKSIHSPVDPMKSVLSQSIGNEDSSRPRRNKSSVCYKESPLKSKKRRP